MLERKISTITKCNHHTSLHQKLLKKHCFLKQKQQYMNSNDNMGYYYFVIVRLNIEKIKTKQS